ncbi:MAG: hypothetical protein AB7N71_02345 [Phycisphaerae bacterium]
MNTPTRIAKTLAPEDLQPGQYITVLHETRQIAPFGAIFADQPVVTTLEPLTLTTWPCDAEILRVIEVCLPLVLVRTYKNEHRMLDVRAVQLARLRKSFAKAAIQRLRANKPESVTSETGCN